jgi:hypothetical protein
MKNRHFFRIAINAIALFALILASLACGSSAPSTAQPSQVVPEQTEPSQSPKATQTPEPTKPPTPTPIGLSRSNPFPRTELVSAPNWEIQVVEFKRGDDAWKDIQAANMFNQAAPEGMEYLLVKIHVKSTYPDSDEHSISGCDFNVTGDRLINYTCGDLIVVAPDPQLNANLFSGGETEGWFPFVIAQGEGNLILAFDEMLNFDSDAQRFIALDEGASIKTPSDLGSTKPNDLGTDRNAPASRADKLITDEWELSILDIIRGNDAWTMIQEANQFNEAPAEGFEYIAVKISVRYIGTADAAANIDGTFFKSTGNANALYDAPFVVSPSPELNVWLYPGGEYQGWIVVQASIGETNMVLVFEPIFDFIETNKRFISLEP